MELGFCAALVRAAPLRALWRSLSTMRGVQRLAAALRRAAFAASPPAASQQQAVGALKQLQRGLGSIPHGAGPRAGAAAAARAPWLAAVAALTAGLGVQLVGGGGASAECKKAEDPKGRVYDKEEVAKHRTKETGARRQRRQGVRAEAGATPAAPRTCKPAAPSGLPA